MKFLSKKKLLLCLVAGLTLAGNAISDKSPVCKILSHYKGKVAIGSFRIGACFTNKATVNLHASDTYPFLTKATVKAKFNSVFCDNQTFTFSIANCSKYSATTAALHGTVTGTITKRQKMIGTLDLSLHLLELNGDGGIYPPKLKISTPN